MRCTTQNMAIEPIAYGGTSSAQRGRRRGIHLNECYESQHNGDESNLSDLDSDVEEGYAGRDSCA